MVWSMFVPVSPSGTGYTFRALTSSTFASSRAVAASSAARSAAASQRVTMVGLYQSATLSRSVFVEVSH